MDRFQNISWELLGVVIGVLGLITSIVIYFLQRNTKRFSYRILTETSLLSVGDEVKGKIKVYYDEKEIENLYLVVLEMMNNGNLEIRTADFEKKPITINFPNSKLVRAEVSNVSPKNLKPIISYEQTQVAIEPLLLNKKDKFTLKMIFSKYGNLIDLDARIIGVKDVEKISIDNDPGISLKWIFFYLLLIALGIFFLMNYLIAQGNFLILAIFLMVVFIVTILVVLGLWGVLKLNLF